MAKIVIFDDSSEVRSPTEVRIVDESEREVTSIVQVFVRLVGRDAVSWNPQQTFEHICYFKHDILIEWYDYRKGKLRDR